MLSYNTSYHSTIAMTLFGTKPRLLSFPNPESQGQHNGELTLAERYQLLQKIRFIDKNIANSNQELNHNLIKVLNHICLTLMTSCGMKILHPWVKIQN
jgi:hypothetical protein